MKLLKKIILIELKAKAQVNIFRPAAKFRFKTFACIFSNKGYWLNFAKNLHEFPNNIND